ncbi:MAG: chalcone isomerase family protein [Stagnimonas sp.]|nr:chalcone isomerase family protein [Stagnimonas sp.]
MAALLAACLLHAGALATPVAGHERVGQGRLSWLGFDAYDAALWAPAGFRATEFARHAFTLELAYLRSFRGSDIAKRSIDEMRRAGEFSGTDADRWRAALERVLPDVRPGDRITGVHEPGRGARFLVNGRDAGAIEDPRFAALFFSIWLGPATSQPALRRALLSGAPP